VTDGEKPDEQQADFMEVMRRLMNTPPQPRKEKPKKPKANNPKKEAEPPK
jgi:hypothetical protein